MIGVNLRWKTNKTINKEMQTTKKSTAYEKPCLEEEILAGESLICDSGSLESYTDPEDFIW